MRVPVSLGGAGWVLSEADGLMGLTSECACASTGMRPSFELAAGIWRLKRMRGFTFAVPVWQLVLGMLVRLNHDGCLLLR